MVSESAHSASCPNIRPVGLEGTGGHLRCTQMHVEEDGKKETGSAISRSKGCGIQNDKCDRVFEVLFCLSLREI